MPAHTLCAPQTICPQAQSPPPSDLPQHPAPASPRRHLAHEHQPQRIYYLRENAGKAHEAMGAVVVQSEGVYRAKRVGILDAIGRG